ncbi:hypothetical protein IMZ31_22070 (plasmid) [Pontibacillus sp. ALD_SL1]|uniref:Piwi domain-containing protein n=1 Tax=Pontibacillus sp. ALD_SL1 TaxID=2777185 RepID=UPI001A972236|nr:Piwi domain-containing protein [Pontibacillus sp. ALD_SL1]QST02141.1 hypothetical protein IMZ31_22070 [Pontibacillus sp. ALD_SL1]
MSYHALSQFKLIQTAKDVPIYIYVLPINNLNERHSELFDVAQVIKKKNKTDLVAFNENMIGSFEPLKEWEDHAPVSSEQRTIDLHNPREVRLLERLVQASVVKEGAKKAKSYYYRGSEIVSYDSKNIEDEVHVHKRYKMDTTVERDGEIFVGLELSHQLFRVPSLLTNLQKNEDIIGMEVTDKRKQKYVVEKVSDVKVGDVHPVLGQSIKDYYSNNGRAKEISIAKDDSPVVSVAKEEGGKPIFYAPELLSQICTMNSFGSRIIKKIKKELTMDPTRKFQMMIDVGMDVINRSRFQTSKKNVLIENQGYDTYQMNPPSFSFGNGHSNRSINYGLKKAGIYESGAEPLPVHILLDNNVLTRFQTNEHDKNQVTFFVEKLKEEAGRMGRGIDVKNVGLDYKNVCFDSPSELRNTLKTIGGKFTEPVIVITEDSRAETCYEVIKRELGKRKGLPTQMIQMDTTGNHYSIQNILLGIYAKSGVQSWLLNQKLHSDLFIGLDVSHEDGVHAAGIVQIVGKDGRVLYADSVSSFEAGEKIKSETLVDIVSEAVHQFKNHFPHETLEHMTFHRDGGGFEEEIEAISGELEGLDIAFDYVSVVKNPRRRMAVYEGNQWKTEQGRVYTKEDHAYMCLTNPTAVVGMAKPIRVTQKHASLPFQDILQDIHDLSYMHIASLRKARLPVTVNYADKASTFFNRGYLPNTPMGKSLHFV